MPSIQARVAEGWRRSRMMRGIRKNAKTYPAMSSARITFFQMPGIAVTIVIIPAMLLKEDPPPAIIPPSPRGGVPKWP